MSTIITRREFMRRSLTVTSTIGLSACSWNLVRGANETIRVGVCGFGGRGKGHIDGFNRIPGVRVVALCDVDTKILARGVADLEKRGQKVEGYVDMRKMLENKDIDLVTTATPNHWHSLFVVWACQAGKDVYVEKPISHNVWEGRQAVKAALKYNRIVQAGTQSRSSMGIREAVEFVQKGGLGKIRVARGLCYKPRGSIGKCDGEQKPPAEVDYDLWSGPAQILPIRRLKFHYDWHWIWAYGNGDLGNQGIHQMDIARWFLGEPELSPRVMSIGGRLGYEDDGETPNTQIIFHEYEKAPLIFEVRGLPSKTGSKSMDKYWPVKFTPPPEPEPAASGSKKSKRTPGDPRSSIGVVVHCENGFVGVPNYASATAFDNDGKVIKEFKGVEDHFANCIKAVRSHKPGDLNGQILEGHLSSALCHTGNISHLLGRQASPDEIMEQIKSNKEAVETFGRFKEHLAANDVDITKTKATLGVWLKMDPKTEQFIDNDKANALLKRDCRKPFLVPEV